MEIRNCTIDDLNDVYRLICDLEDFELNFDKFKYIYVNKLEDEKYHYLVAVENQNVIGFVSVNIDYHLHHEDKVATIEELVMNKQYRGHGIGKALITYVKQLALDHHCEVIELTSKFARTRAHQFYEQNGFFKASYKLMIDFKKNGYEI